MSNCRTYVTTSRRQGQSREGWSEGSPSAKVRADGQKPHRRLSLRASQHQMTRPTGKLSRRLAVAKRRQGWSALLGDVMDMKYLFSGGGLSFHNICLEIPSYFTAILQIFLAVMLLQIIFFT